MITNVLGWEDGEFGSGLGPATLQLGCVNSLGHHCFSCEMKPFIGSNEPVCGLHNLRLSPSLKITASDGETRGNQNASATD